MSKRTKTLDESTSVRLKRRTAVVLATIAKAKDKTADEVIWRMLQQVYPTEIKLVQALADRDDYDEN
jgi:hypothetical protein